MKLDEFIKNLARVEEGRNLDKYRCDNQLSFCLSKVFRQMLTGIYERVKEFEFRAGTDHVTQVMKVDQSIISKDKPVYFMSLKKFKRVKIFKEYSFS
jgi:IQ motif/SEC7 domain-containing protein